MDQKMAISHCYWPPGNQAGRDEWQFDILLTPTDSLVVMNDMFHIATDILVHNTQEWQF